MPYSLIMLPKILTLVAFLSAQLTITWYGYFMGKVAPRGEFFGIAYDSMFFGLLITQLKFIWIIILINMLYGLGFQWGNASFQNFMIVISLWIAAGPIAAVLFNSFVTKEPIDLPIIGGIILVTAGAILIVTHKEISTALQKISF